MKMTVTTTYDHASLEFVEWMANNMKKHGQISNEQAQKLKNDGHLELVTKAADDRDPIVSTTIWQVIE